MNYRRPELLDQLAAAYALGSLRGRARARFERLSKEFTPALMARHRWEDRLLPLALALPPILPRDTVLPGIRQKLSADYSSSAQRPRLRWWQAAGAASLVAVALLIGRVTIWSEPAWQPMATLAQANAAPMWRVERTADSSRLILRTVGPVNLSATNSYELWVIPAAGGNPVSLGLMPTQDDVERTLTAQQQALLLTAMNIAVSLEPAGGSPNGMPTTVIIVAPVAALS